jgi:DNA-binding NarL/FixJ family response regulator
MSSAPPSDDLRGLRVLLVEDSYLVASSLSRMIRDLGGEVVGPVATVQEALPLVSGRACDVGILDVNLGGETSEPVANRFVEMKLPFMFVTGYSSPTLMSDRFQNARRVHKPVSEAALAMAIRATVEGGTEPSP